MFTAKLWKDDCDVESHSFVKMSDAVKWVEDMRENEAIEFDGWSITDKDGRWIVEEGECIRRGRPKVNEDALTEAMAMFASGEHTIEEIVEITGISNTTIYRYAKEYRINHPKKRMGRPKVDSKAVEKAIEMYISGEYTVKEIAKTTGISPATIHRRVREMGVKRPEKKS